MRALTKKHQWLAKPGSMSHCSTWIFLLFMAVAVTVSLEQQPSLPQFSQDIYKASVNETSSKTPPPDTGFLIVECSTNNVTYSISDQRNAGPFEIDSFTGSLSATMDVDYETATSYQFTVNCMDMNDALLNDSSLVMIMIEPVNEFLPVIVQMLLGFNRIDELTPPGTVIVAGQGIDFTVVDEDSGPDGIITFSLSSIDRPEFASHFELNKTTGTLILNSSIDLDNQEERIVPLNVRITACDVDPPAAECPNLLAFILLGLSNDNPPIFSNNVYTITIAESFPVNEVIATVSCSDIDHNVGTFDSYTIFSVFPNGTPTNTFSIDSSTGNITLLQPLDCKFTPLYEIVVLCQDSGGLQDNATVVIVVIGNDKQCVVMTSDGEFNTTIESDVAITVSGSLSIPEIVIIIVAPLLFIAFIIMIICCCSICCRWHSSRKPKFNKPSATDTIDLNQFNTAIDNFGYGIIDGCLDEDVQAKIQASAVESQDGGREKPMQDCETKPVAAATEENAQKNKDDKERDASVLNDGKEEKPNAPSVHIHEDIDWGTVPTLKKNKELSSKK